MSKHAKKVTVTRSSETRQKISEGSRAFHDANINAAHDKVRSVMVQIQQEMVSNSGMYPHNKGVISQAELARRASMHPVTLHKPYYKELIREIKEWLVNVNSGAIVGHKRVRSTLTSRLDEHEKLRISLQESLRISEIDLDISEAKVEELEKRCQFLEENNMKLRNQLAQVASLKIVKRTSPK